MADLLKAVAGPYTATYGELTGVLGTNFFNIGIVQDGFEIEVTYEGEEIIGDNLGQSVQDGVHQGGNCFVNFTLEQIEVSTNSGSDITWEMLWPHDISAGAVQGVEGRVGVVGSLWTAGVQSLILTPIDDDNTTMEALKYYFPWTIIPSNYPIRQMLASSLRRIPVRLQCLPYLYSNNYVWFYTAVNS